ncbi:bifunctional diaminohydroxyphosphoribosylaminopyrimidine deaminase/5-amino-6-(5-phosphoribosylamino)uracil reductase RibD [Aquimarina brevivitae]|uniref:Riboflavin biosynthesis protein RibD n=1 Tax=Aquimarina brevivitae TaxID=323412 RepID=A0A4Q7NZY4_9FLAO|nr:diaminohydroxyphosphoribosylaminopyrimidine deaminase [Aquimarina brevivitae]
MKRCIELARLGLGSTYPNPMVGSVIVYDNKIIGEGWHDKSGNPHAEVNAINAVDDKKLLKKATIYVSLEPCSHYGKTPPCSDLIIEKGIKKVVIGTVDPNKQVAGKGIQKLLNAGCKVVVGVEEDACLEINKRFFTYHQKKRPFIILKWAESIDGFIAPNQKDERAPVWISNLYSRQLTHKWRTEEQAILVGGNTVLADNPSLTSRTWQGNNPLRVVIGSKAKLPEGSAVLNTEATTLIFSTDDAINIDQLANHEIISLNPNENTIKQVLSHLYDKHIQSLIIEGGLHTLSQFINQNLWDEARIFIGSKMLLSGVKAPNIKGKVKQEKPVLNDTLKILFND